MAVQTQDQQPEGLARRDLLRRAATFTVATAWAVPVVQTLGPAALAADGSPRPTTGGGNNGGDVDNGNQGGGQQGGGQQGGGNQGGSQQPATKPPTGVLGEKFERGGLPRTGTDAAAMTAAAVALTAGGAAAYAAAKKRQQGEGGDAAPRHAAP
ncbi:MAG: LPXTG cell wall anchor domain-containing protein [Motilibacteraceae bacterium]